MSVSIDPIGLKSGKLTGLSHSQKEDSSLTLLPFDGRVKQSLLNVGRESEFSAWAWSLQSPLKYA